MRGRRPDDERRFSPRAAAFITFLLVSAAPHLASAANSLPADARVRFDEKRRTIRTVEGKDLLASLPKIAAMSRRDPAAASIAFVAQHREVFRLTKPGEELKLDSVQRDDLRFRHVRFAQVFRGLEVANCEMRFHFNRDGALYRITGSYIPTPDLADVQPKLDRAAAVRAAASAVGGDRSANWPATLKIWPAQNGAAVLAYEVAATVAADRAWRVFVDADSGKILDRISTIHTAAPTDPAQPNRTSRP